MKISKASLFVLVILACLGGLWVLEHTVVPPAGNGAAPRKGARAVLPGETIVLERAGASFEVASDRNGDLPEVLLRSGATPGGQKPGTRTPESTPPPVQSDPDGLVPLRPPDDGFQPIIPAR